MKTCSNKSFAKLEQGKLREVQPKHYAQCQIYQKRFDCDYALYIAVNKDNDDIFIDTIELNGDHYKEYCDKAEFITMADKPPERIASKPTAFQCKFCNAHSVCWGMDMARVNCRNCTSADKDREKGVFNCEKNSNKKLDERGYCESHSWNPYAIQDMLGYSPIEFFPSQRAVKYQRQDGTEFTNGFDFIRSKDLK